MRPKIPFVFAAIVVFAFVLSACGGVPTRQENPRTLSITGSGSVSITPDIAYISIGVQTESPSVIVAVDENTDVTQKVIDSLTKNGVAAEDIHTSNFSIWPNNYYDEWGEPTEMTNVVDNTVYVTVRDLSKMGELLDASISAGANTIYGISFDLDDKSNAMKEARELAVKNAQAQAADLAAAAGVTLDEIQAITYYDTGYYPYSDYGGGERGGGGGGGYPVPISPGTLQLSTSVDIVYFIK